MDNTLEYLRKRQRYHEIIATVTTVLIGGVLVAGLVTALVCILLREGWLPIK